MTSDPPVAPPARELAWARWALALGALLRVLDWAGNRSLWNDEAALALNLIERDGLALLGPLDYGQMAPPGFLLAVDGLVALLGIHEAVLRLVPLALSLASLPLFLAVARRCLTAGGLALACLLFAISQPLVHYAGELKQYGGDATAALLLLWLALRARDEALSARRCLELGVAGAILPWLSHAALLVMAGVGPVLGWRALRERRSDALVRLAMVAVLWLVPFAVQYAAFLGDMVATDYMRSFWAFAFLPFPPASASEWLWLPRHLLWIFERSAGLDPGLLAAAFSVVGLASLARREGELAWLLTLPLLVALVASAFESYPFFQRFLFFAVPGVLILVAEGVRAVVARTGSRPVVAAGIVMLLVVLPARRTARDVMEAWQPQGLRPVLERMLEEMEPGDAIYVYHGADYVHRYYARRLDDPRLAAAVRGASPYEAHGPAEARRARQGWHVREAARLAGGGRTWLVFTNVRTWGGRSDEERLVAALERSGRQLAHHASRNASVYLFDLEGASAPSDPGGG